MIVAKNADAANYKGFSPLLDKALDLLTPEFLATVGTDTVHLDGDKLYATLNLFETAPDSETFFESHKRYLDSHVPLGGVERMDIAHPADLALNLGKSNEAGDFYAYEGEAREKQSMILKPGTFLVAFPEDAHRVKMQAGEKSAVTKVVFKILWKE
jgi:YhcH/YjgK/YiaL family protein